MVILLSSTNLTGQGLSLGKESLKLYMSIDTSYHVHVLHVLNSSEQHPVAMFHELLKVWQLKFSPTEFEFLKKLFKCVKSFGLTDRDRDKSKVCPFNL